MSRVVSLYLPTWPTDRLRRKMGAAAPDPTMPLVLVGQAGRRREVVAANAVAIRIGLRVGMPATKAQALVKELMIHHADPAADGEALERLAVWALRYSPVVAIDGPDGLVIDATGASHLHGGEDAILADMISRLESVGITARAAMADTRGAAYALARFAAQSSLVIPERESAERIKPLPIAALRLTADMVDDLRRLGFERVSDLLATPRAPLTLRFGPELGRRMDQATGRTGDPIESVRPPDIIETQQLFAEPIGAPETIARYVAKMTIQLCQEMELRGLGARRLDLLFGLVDNRVQAIRIGTAQPVRDAKRLTRLLCDKIEKVDPGFGIEIMRLAATAVDPFNTKQTISSLVDEPEADISGLIDILSNRVGETRLYRFEPVASDVPERSFRRVAAAAPVSEESWPAHWPRPARLLAAPELIETVALLPDHPPVNFTWRGLRRRVRRADGPERVFGEWWKRDAELIAVRDYFQVEDDAGERFWIFRAGDGEDAATGSHKWFLHGIFG
ncbi:DNA polymerase Y family protein [Nitrobacter sp. NHB1]|uniref:Y-family DNA polymerase n=1 Tax=Nitrobacter sp. NHB1 TaxID=3119830 RepID=UPI002FFEE180